MRFIATAMLAFFCVGVAAHAQETQPTILCDTQNEITAVVQSDDWHEAMTIIDRDTGDACAELHALFYSGKRAQTIDTPHGLYDILPLFIVGVEGMPVAGRLQWGAFKSSLLQVTWKPEYGQSPEAVQQWFHEAELTPAAKLRFPFTRCCEKAERLMTKFVAGDKGDSWSYYPDPDCTHKGCPLKPIPNDIVHDETIHALDPKDDELPQFKAMRVEGVLMIYQDQPTCFWPPAGGI